MAGRAVSVEWLGGTNLDGRVAVRWMTSDEPIELAFRVERQDADTGRFTAVLPEPLPARGSARGAIYTLIDPNAPVGVPATYRLAALLDDTNTIAFGPYPVLVPVDKLRLQSKLADTDPSTLFSATDLPLTDFELQRNQERQAELLTVQAMLAASAPGARKKMATVGVATLAGGATPLAGAGAVQRLKIGVMTTGVYRLSAAYLAAAFNLAESDLQTAIRATKVALSCQGHDVAWAADTNASAVLFYGIPAVSRYTTENIYWLSLTNGFNLLPRPTAPAAQADTNQSFLTTLHFESSNHFSYAQGRSLDGPLVVSGTLPQSSTVSLTFNLIEAVYTNATITVIPTLISRMTEASPDTHNVGVLVNRSSVTNVAWNGEALMNPVAQFSQSILSNGVNTLLLTNATRTSAGYVLYAGFDVTYWRTYRASGDALGFVPSGNTTVTIWGFTNGPPTIWDVTDPYAPSWIEGASNCFTNGAWQATFTPGAPTNRFFAFSSAGYLAPSRLKAEGAATDLCAATNGADWVMVIPPLYRLVNFRNQAERLAAWRSAQGLCTMVLDYEDLCDAFRYGLDTPFAIRDFVGASARWITPPRFLVLGGHGDYDYLWNITNQCLLPPYMVPSTDVPYSEGAGFFSADSGLVDANGDGMPDLAVGRIPAVSSNEFARFVDKVITYESPADKKMRIEVIADDPNSSSGKYAFDTGCDSMSACIPTNTYTVFKDYAYSGNFLTLRSAVTNHLWNGVGLMSFFGHATTWSIAAGSGELLNSQYDFRWPFPTIGVGLACSLNRYEYPGAVIGSNPLPSFGEVGVASTNAFSAFFACSGPADVAGDRAIGEEFYKSMFVNKAARLGEATQTAIRGYWSQLMRFQYMVEMYTLLGDPGMVIDQKRLTVSSAAGQAWPPVGSDWIGDFTNLACAVTNGVLTQGTTQLVCTGWSGAGSAPTSGTTTNTGVFFVTQDATVHWLWKTQYLVTAGADSNGAVWGSTGWVDRAATARLTAVPADGYRFLGWIGAVDSTNNPLNLVVTDAVAVAATFTNNAPDSWTITAFAGAHGTVNPAGGIQVDSNGASFAITPDAYYHVADLTVDGVSVGAATNYAFTAVDSNHTLAAAFAADTRTLDVVADRGQGDPSTGNHAVDYGAGLAARVTNSVVYEGVNATQYVCAGWARTGSAPASGTNASTELFTITNDTTVAWFWRTNVFLNVAAGNGGSVDAASGWRALGAAVTITATAAAHYDFDHWEGDTNATVSLSSNRATFVMDRARGPLTAVFSPRHYTLTIGAQPYGTPDPAAGVTTNDLNAVLRCGISGSPVELSPQTTQFVCLGWTGTGSAPASGPYTSTVFRMTADSTLDWFWATNLWLSVITNGPGMVDVASGWQALGSNVTLTATAGAHWHFFEWTGDIEGGGSTGAALTVPMNHPRAVTANFAWDQYTLTVASPCGQTEPAPGVYTNDYGTQVSAGVTNTPYEIAALATQLVSVGWSGTGSAPASGTETNTGFFALTNAATVDWLWHTNLYLAASVSGFGTLDVASGWQPRGTTVVVRVTPDYKNHLVGWSGGTNGCVMGSNSIAVPMTAARQIEALVETNSQQKLTVVSDVGQTEPLPGQYEYDFGAEVASGVTNAILYAGLDATQYVSMGWTGTGSAPASGVGTNTGNFNLTLPSVVTWLWRTNYHLGVTVTGGGTTDVGMAWVEAGTTATVHAVADPHRHFAFWSGDLDGASMTGAVISVVMDRPRAVTAVFTSNEWYTFTVASAHGAGDPAPGATSHEWGTSLSAGLTNATVYDGVLATQYVSLGWTGTGSAPASGSSTNTGSFAITNDTTLTWLWKTNYYLDLSVEGNGGINQTSHWCMLGSNVVVLASNDLQHVFLDWGGDTNGCGITNNSLTAAMNQFRRIVARFDAVTAEAYIPGANAVTSSVPMYQNNINLYPIPGHRDPGFGICFATYVADVLGYWDRTTYTNNGIQYWNLVDHGVAPLRQPVGAGQEDADVYGLILPVGTMYYTTNMPSDGGWDDVVIRQQCNTNLGLAFGSTLYPGQIKASTPDQFVTLYTQIVVEVDAGHPVGAGFYGSTYFGSAHQVPVLGYVRMSNMVDSLLYIHRNQSPARSEYINYFAASSGTERDMATIIPGGVPVDGYHRAGIGTNAATAAALNPDDPYGFRQTHCFTSTADAVWIALTNLAGRQYTVDICHRGTNADTLLTLLAGDRQTVVAQGSTQLTWRCWTTGANYLVVTPGSGVANGAWAWANFDVEVDYTNVNPWLVVASPVGGTWPTVGTNAGFTNGAVISASVTNSPFTVGGGTQYVCAGWTRDGSAPGSGTGASTGPFTLTNDTILAWQWTTNLFLLVQTTNGPGITDPTNGWFQSGTNTPVTAQPGDYYHFAGWSGDTNGIVSVVSNLVNVPMTVPRVLTASFQPNLATNQTPEWWLAAHGLTNGGFNAGAMDDADGDGMPNWAEYRAGTDPTNRFSLLMFDSVAPEANSTWIVMRWQSAGGKSYRLERGTNLTDQAPFSTLLRTNITATAPMNVETDKTAVGEGPWFYRIELE